MLPCLAWRNINSNIVGISYAEQKFKKLRHAVWLDRLLFQWFVKHNTQQLKLFCYHEEVLA